MAPKPIREEAGTVVIPSIVESRKPTAIESVNGVFALTLTEHSRKVLLSLEAASHCDVEYTYPRRAQHLLRTLYLGAQYKLVWRLARRLAKHPGEMSASTTPRPRGEPLAHASSKEIPAGHSGAANY